MNAPTGFRGEVRGSALAAAAVAPALLAVAMAAAAPPPAAAQAGLVVRDLKPIDELVLAVDGKTVEDARIYRAAAPPAILILTGELPAPVLVLPGRGTVETVDPAKLVRRPGGAVDLLPEPILAPQGAFELAGEAVVFTVEGRPVRLEPRPPLLGLKTAAELAAYSSLYAEGAAAYEPDELALELLEGETRPVRVRVFFGSWCPLCQRTVPSAVRLTQELEGSSVRIEFYGLPRGFRGESQATRYGVSAVPTGVILLDGREIGRIQGEGWVRPEWTIRQALREQGAGDR